MSSPLVRGLVCYIFS